MAIALFHQPEEGVDLLGLEGEISNLVNQEDGIAGKGLDESLSGSVGKGGIELVEELLGVAETASVAGQNGLAQEAYSKAGFSRTGISYEDHVLSALHEGEAGQGLDLGSVEIGLALEGERLQSPVAGRSPRVGRYPAFGLAPFQNRSPASFL